MTIRTIIIDNEWERIGCRLGQCKKGSIPMENVLLSPLPTETEKPIPELGRHDVVENRIEGRIDISHNSCEVQNSIIGVRMLG